MMRLLGAALVAFGCAWMGFQRAAALKDRVRALKSMVDGVALLGQELELNGPALSVLMERLSRRSWGAAQNLFCNCRMELGRLGEEPFSQLWSRLVEERGELGREGQDCLLSLGNVLGCCGVEEQLQAIESVRRRLERLAGQAEETCRVQRNVYQVLGVSGGVFLVILLL